MSILLDSIAIDFREYEGFCLGAVIDKNLEKIKETGANVLHLRICNEHWHGTFQVPSAVGFSTPIGVLKGATLSLCRDEQTTAKVFEEFKEWKEFYKGKLVRRDILYTFTSDKKTCSICLEDYMPGDELTINRKCDHVFHAACQRKWKVSGKNTVDLLTRIISERSIQFNCPLCREKTT